MSEMEGFIRQAQDAGILPLGVLQYLPFRNEQGVTNVLGGHLVVRQDKADGAITKLLAALIAERKARQKAEAATEQLQWMLDYVLNAIADESGCVTLQEGDASTTYFSADGCREHLAELYEEGHGG